MRPAACAFSVTWKNTSSVEANAFFAKVMKCVPFNAMRGLELHGVFLAQQRHAIVTINVRHQMWWAWLLDQIEGNSTRIEEEDEAEIEQRALDLWYGSDTPELFVLRNEDGSVDVGPEKVSVKKEDDIGIDDFHYVESYYVNRLADEFNGIKLGIFNDI